MAAKRPTALLQLALAIQNKREAYYRARSGYLRGKLFGTRFLAG